ncbi:sporulation histidine kinase inhibitor Sda [Shouchella miscanthi]|nr:sporulation histidine kinase inhibitor Sda [Shouchella miscanthi]
MSLKSLPNHCLLEAYTHALSLSLPEDFVLILKKEILLRMQSNNQNAPTTSFVLLPKSDIGNEL